MKPFDPHSETLQRQFERLAAKNPEAGEYGEAHGDTPAEQLAHAALYLEHGADSGLSLRGIQRNDTAMIRELAEGAGVRPGEVSLIDYEIVRLPGGCAYFR